MAEGNEVVLVTGASGCLGQHIVKLLQERDDSVKEIRLFDLKSYKNNLGHDEKKPMKQIVGDVRNKQNIQDACVGVDCVIHAAAYIDLSMFPDTKVSWAHNVEGTKNVISACIQNSVPRLIFCSTTDVMYGGEHIFYGMESTTIMPKKFPIGIYAETKAEAEELVLKANKQPLANGKGTLRTLSLRPTPIYGEEDNHLVTAMITKAKTDFKGVLLRVHSLDERMQITYAGNAAWAHIKAKERLIHDESISGEEFFINDDTPIIDLYENLRPYLEAAKVKLSDYVYPYWLVYFGLIFLTFVLRLISPIYKPKIELPTPGMVAFLCSTIFFNRSKATLRLNYQPIYTPEEAKQKTTEYFQKAKI